MPVVVALIAMLVAAAVAGNRRVSANAGVRESAVAASMPRDGVRSSAWYCSGGPVGRGPSGDQVAISDVGPRPVRVALDVMADANDASASATSTVPEHFVTIAANSTTTIPVASLSRSPAAAVVVEPLGDGVVVEQGYSLTGDVAMTPCATRTSSTWYFAAGASVGGTQTWLSLLNPYADDAVVDVEAESESGLRAPGSLQGIVVPHGSRLAVRMDQKVAEQKIVAVTVSVRGGSRIVATQSVVQARRGGGSNASISLGAVAPARTWMFADNRSTAGALQPDTSA